MAPLPDSARGLLRHSVATLSYRIAKILAGTPDSFAAYAAGPGSRTPAQILAHMGDLLDWALSMAKGKQAWRDSTPLPWAEEQARFFTALLAFDAWLAGDEPLGYAAERLFQGPVADALTHAGQIAYLRRMAGLPPVRGENYAKAVIEAGAIGPTYSSRRVEFD
ncbi:MAG TPA: hypothetical protein VLD58_02220 [Gemmatimonadales bacterium]|nr:hypothetical protein [Gemmatimonadales bacterium]